MPDLIDQLGQMAEEIREGETLVMQLRHLKRESAVSQEEVNDTLSLVEYYKRLYTTRRLRVEAAIAGVVIQEVPETPRERAFREKLRRFEG